MTFLPPLPPLPWAAVAVLTGQLQSVLRGLWCFTKLVYLWWWWCVQLYSGATSWESVMRPQYCGCHQPASLLPPNSPLVRLARPVWLSELLTPADCWHWVEEDGVGVPQVPDWGVAPVDCLTLTTAWLASTHSRQSACLLPLPAHRLSHSLTELISTHQIFSPFPPTRLQSYIRRSWSRYRNLTISSAR